PRGRQPMKLEDGSAVSFNGCIYNFQELRSELERSDGPFRSESDTEVILRGYRRWGIDDLVTKLRGMFAFALWDEAQGRGFLVRDRLGVKPLVFVERAGMVAFASTIEALRKAGLLGELRITAVGDFLAH